MKEKKLSKVIEKAILIAQGNEITEHFVYDKLSKATRDSHNKRVLKRIAKEELEHYRFWKGFTNQDVPPSRWTIWKYYLIAKIFGVTFGIKLMERGEERAQASYEKISEHIPSAKRIEEDEEEHEKALIGLIDEERMQYIGSMVLGLNDALVELTGALAGLTLALRCVALYGRLGVSVHQIRRGAARSPEGLHLHRLGLYRNGLVSHLSLSDFCQLLYVPRLYDDKCGDSNWQKSDKER